jgi:hypothetical protein
MQDPLDPGTYVGWDFTPPSTDTWSISAGQYPLINGYAIIAPPDWASPTPTPPPPTPPAPSPTAAPGATGNTVATDNAVIALEAAAGGVTLEAVDEGISDDQKGDETPQSDKKDKDSGEQKTYEKTRGDKGKNFCN